jgi:hypothetical protein
MEKTVEFKATESLSMENSYATVKEQNNIKLNVSITLWENRNGWRRVVRRGWSLVQW